MAFANGWFTIPRFAYRASVARTKPETYVLFANVTGDRVGLLYYHGNYDDVPRRALHFNSKDFAPTALAPTLKCDDDISSPPPRNGDVCIFHSVVDQLFNDHKSMLRRTRCTPRSRYTWHCARRCEHVQLCNQRHLGHWNARIIIWDYLLGTSAARAPLTRGTCRRA